MGKFTTYKVAEFSTAHITSHDDDLLQQCVEDLMQKVLKHKSALPTMFGIEAELDARIEAILKESDHDDLTCLIVYGKDQGYWIHCGCDIQSVEDDLEKAKAAGFSGAFCKIVWDAHNAGCRWVEFDADGEQYEDYPKFKW